jgi:isopenicillin N synthase-like dioxygenase
MNIGIDFDDTYTRDPATWDKVLDIFRKAGHKIYLVTWRNEGMMPEVYEKLDGKVHGFFATDLQAKKEYTEKNGVLIDVWIDDYPWAINNSSEYKYDGEFE